MIYGLIGILIAIIVVQAFVLHKQQRQVKDICRQLAFLKKHESNLMITNEIQLGGIRELTDELNELLEIRKNERKRYLEKENMIADIYTNLSHDIRTPLTSLDGYFQLLEECENEEERKRYIAIIQERINSLKEMLEELFTFTKLKNDAYQMEITECHMNRILKESVFSYYEEWRNRGIEPKIEIADEALYVMGNQAGLKRVIQNVIKNTLVHGQKELLISLNKEDGQIKLVIGNLVDRPEQIDVTKVFERFYKADEARSKTSTGLGLAIAKELVVRMNGEIEAVLEGNQFRIEVWLPVV